MNSTANSWTKGAFMNIHAMPGFAAAPNAAASAAASHGPMTAGRFNPYNDNGGTVAAISGEDYAVIASDMRMSDGGYGIESRNVSKLSIMTGTAALGSAGMQSDRLELQKILSYRMKEYKLKNGKEMSTTALAEYLSKVLYGRRMMPYYTFNVLAGIDEDGRGGVYGYDAIGSFERSRVICTGSGQQLIQPLLDNQVEGKNQAQLTQPPTLTLEEATELLKDAFCSATERDIYTGDRLELIIITKEGVRTEYLELKKD